ncbi:hypothetical protein EI77_04107 [Prosthecobacter fusiformis]|uniref:Uncharacterized protein n=1 Tax=Prosthecobacter fusiformis TaxID=48464 RepID=A0A4R7RLK8_9BACT|nr:hypothetical protein EI77_04107 [Prosthecobacter fusiformis]
MQVKNTAEGRISDFMVMDQLVSWSGQYAVAEFHHGTLQQRRRWEVSLIEISTKEK